MSDEKHYIIITLDESYPGWFGFTTKDLSREVDDYFMYENRLTFKKDGTLKRTKTPSWNRDAPRPLLRDVYLLIEQFEGGQVYEYPTLEGSSAGQCILDQFLSEGLKEKLKILEKEERKQKRAENKARREEKERKEQKEYERLRAKYGDK